MKHAIRSISTTPRHFVLGLLKSRVQLINVFLIGWMSLLLLLIGSDMAAILTTGQDTPISRNILLALTIGIALWQNRIGRPGTAMVIVTGTIFTVVTLSAYETGLHGPITVLDRYYIPTVLAALMLNRRALILTGIATVVVTLALLGMQSANLLPGAQAGVTAATLRTTVQFLAIYLTMLVVLDQFGTVVRDNLARAAERDGKLHAALAAKLETERELEDERRLNEAIVANIPGLLFVMDESGNLLRSGERPGVHTPERPLGPATIGELLPEVSVDILNLWLDETLTTGTATRVFHLKDGSSEPVPYTVEASKLELAERQLIVGVGLDTSELNDAKQQIEVLNVTLQGRLQRLTALHQIDKAIIGSLDLRLTLDVILSEISRELNVDAATILLYRPAMTSLQWAAGRGFRTSQALQGFTLPLGKGAAGTAALQRELVLLQSSDEIERVLVGFPRLADEGFNGYLAVPLIAKGKLQGVLELFDRGTLNPDTDWYEYLNALATQAAIALDNASLFEGMERANTELLQAYDTTIEGWSRALDLRDHETEGHSQRVTNLSLTLAERLGFTDEELVHLRRGALLHDIGKMGVPDSILLKEGQLDDDELAIMREHPNLALELLAPISFLQPALDIPYAHHEKWDGTGYPQGLAGERIPKAARVFALADVFDALTSDRPYRAAWTVEKALALIESESGKHFDPVIAEEFLAMLRED